MKKNNLRSAWPLFFMLISLPAWAQISFEKGYFVDNEGRRTECYIKNLDWENCPNEFHYSLEASGPVLTGDLETVQEFRVEGYFKYVRATVRIDRSPDDLSELSRQRNPIWSEEKVFLRVLKEGTANLYLYSEMNFVRFFFSSPYSNLQQLICKEYWADDFNTALNNDFRQQLAVFVNCRYSDDRSYENIHYRQKELEKYFQAYNECEGDSLMVTNVDASRVLFRLRATPGLDQSSLVITQFLPFPIEWDYGSSFTLRLGLDAELVMPFNKNKWSITFEPTLRQVNFSDPEDDLDPLKYLSFELATGIRYYFYLKENNRLFLDAYLASVVSYDNGIRAEVSFGELDIRHRPNFAFGAGYANKWLGLEFRYYTPQNILDNYTNWGSDLQKLSLILALRLVEVR